MYKHRSAALHRYMTASMSLLIPATGVAWLFWRHLQQRRTTYNHSGQPIDKSLSSAARPGPRSATTQPGSGADNIPVATDTASSTDGPVAATQPATPQWSLVGASVIGADHVRMNLPCQDANYYKLLKNGWGLAIVADGGGSNQHAELGAQHVARKLAPHYFRALLKEQGWAEGQPLPDDQQWQALAKQQIKQIVDDLHEYAEKQGVPFRSLGGTLIVVLFGPDALLITHVGDGRAGYKDSRGGWLPMMEPTKGEYANVTPFLTSLTQPKAFDVYVRSRIVRGEVQAFTLLTDGCEQVAYYCRQPGANGIYFDLNRPAPKFFDPLVEQLTALIQSEPADVIEEIWTRFLTDGTPGLAAAYDDKTMILGMRHMPTAPDAAEKENDDPDR